MQLVTSMTLLLTLCLVAESVLGSRTRSEESGEEKRDEEERRDDEERSEEDFYKRSSEDKRHGEGKRDEEDGREEESEEERSSEDLGRLEMLFRELRGTLSARSRGSCEGNKCASGSKCMSAETPLAKIGINYTCRCPRKKGGYFCEIDDPCKSCPSGTKLCLGTNVSKEGKFCYDSSYRLLNSVSRSWVEDEPVMKRGYIGYEDLS